ncbi:major facilitator superfamily domain-containing protein [Copromyces sp. CBS 386.78]|nr:major facilitator superfamily domain-containing protein [Copromyces sp. CBS 386.78]
MVQPTGAANTAAGATSSTSQPQTPRTRRTRRPPRPQRTTSSGSFHAGAPFPQFTGPYNDPRHPSDNARRSSVASIRPLRRQSHHHYHTFPTQPPKTPSSPPRNDPWSAQQRRGGGVDDGSTSGTSQEEGDAVTPLPWKQLGLLALLSLAEQTALNSISPYLPTMVASFDEIPDGDEGLYVGLLASAFALAQLVTNLFWGYLSDRIGRKPVMLVGTLLLMGCFVFFGFCKTYVQLILVHIAMGLLNGNAAVVPTALGEVTDRTNQSRAFTWLPVMYSLGSITGPALGGLLVGTVGADKYPFLGPNLLSAGFLFIAVVVLTIWFRETSEKGEEEDASDYTTMFNKARTFFVGCLGRCKKSNNSNEDEALLGQDDDATSAKDDVASDQKSAFRQLANRTTLILLCTYLVFQLTNISFNSLYPIFASAAPPNGRNLGPSTIGLSLSLAGLATIVFQAFVFQPLKARVGNMGTYRYSLLGMAIAMALMPWIGYVDQKKTWFGVGSGKGWLYSELGVILLLKNICAIGGLSSVMLLITNSAPSHESLGTLNGIAQTLSAAGRSVGPFISGGLFTLTNHVQPKGEAIAWGVFAGVALLGWFGTLMIRGRELESADWQGEEGDEDNDEEAANDSDR